MKSRLLTLALCAVLFNIHAQTNQITLLLNLSEQSVSQNGVHVAGNFQNWNPSSTPMVDEGNGIFSYTFEADEFANLSFKFINGNDWPFQEIVPSGCGLPDGFGGNNRILETGASDVIYGPVCFGSCSDCATVVEPNTVNVTFLVNMSEQSVSENGVHIAGNFQGWNPSASTMTDLGNGIFEFTAEVAVNSEAQFKFINGNDWPFQETVPSGCGVNDGFGGFNRSIQVGESDITLGPLCFGACEDCGIVVEPTFVTVVFQVNMSNEVVSPQGVHIAGNFQGWNPNGTVMTDLGGGNFELAYEVEANSTIQFRFINGSEWADAEIVPAECGVLNEFNDYNRVLEVGSENMIFGPVCFASCTNCVPLVPVMIVFQVDMSNETVNPEGVFVAGNFNGWSETETQLASNGDGTYSAVAFVNANSTIVYKFLNGPSFSGQENVPMECGVANGFGGYDRTLEVIEDAITLPMVCFSSCSSCVEVPSVDVTFNVDMTGQTISPNGVFVAGTFNNFSPNASQMNNIGNNIYSLTVTLPENTNVLYKFLNGNSFAGVESVPFACGVDDGFGGYNRNLVTSNMDVQLPNVCFSSCAPCTIINVQDMQENEIAIWPNPFHDRITLQGIGSGEQYVIYDLTGRSVFEGKTSMTNETIDLEQLKAGTYVIRLFYSNLTRSILKK